jgi:hypothetical protein
MIADQLLSKDEDEVTIINRHLQAIIDALGD